MTATGLLLGSPAYIAPEVAGGVPAGPISDAWSLGGLLFACVEGRPPFDQGTAIATLTSVVKDPVPPHPHSGRLGAVVSGLLVKTPALRMRVDRALIIMRGIADDPSGTNLAVAAKIPRDGAPQPRTPSAPTGSSVPGRHAAGPATTSAGSPGAYDSRSPLHATPRPPATSPADASTHPPGTPAIGPFGPGQGPPPGPSAGQPSLRPYHLPHPTGAAPFPRPVNASFAGPAEALPPPPWAQSESATLAPLPETAAETPNRTRVIVAVLVALVAAVAGFFGVRIIADLATEGAAAAPVGSVIQQQTPAAWGLPGT